MTSDSTVPYGYTVLELLMALALTGLLATTAIGLVGLADEVIEAATMQRARLDDAIGRGRWVEDALRSISAYDPVERAGFHGQPSGFETRAWLPSPYGGHEIAPLEIRVLDGRLVASTGQLILAFRDSLLRAALAYAGAPDGPTVWLDKWDSPDAPPSMIRLITEDRTGRIDTMLWYVGARQ